ncbi:MAG TPA: ribose-5-phosphate isomerase RpiA [Candidatus Micrarchaeia archaeon]|nr:ribose-5-phosphate isomerase RpiA [Candidatus Micrarchaeia archaeon]
MGAAAAARIEPDLRLGLGSGRTVGCFLHALAPRIAAGLRVRAVCTSVATEQLARAVGVEILSGESGPLDLDVDGADELDDALRCLKGGGGALLREKVVAASSRRLWILVTAEKRVARLGTTFALPVEVLPFGWEWTQERVRGLGLEPTRRGGADPVATDNGNFLLDCRVPGGVTDPARLDRELHAIPGVIEHGLFLGLATAALVARGDGVEQIGDLKAVRPGSG